jgi:hypothetical protein
MLRLASGVVYDKKIRLYRYIVFAVLLVPTSDAQKYGPVWFPDGGHPDWLLLIASLDGFCFHYPPIYEVFGSIAGCSRWRSNCALRLDYCFG